MAVFPEARMPGRVRPLVVSLRSQRNWIKLDELAKRLQGGLLDDGRVKFVTETDEPVDVTVVLNYLPYDTRITCREGGVWKWDLEPLVAQPVARGYDRIYTHLSIPGDSRVQTAPPILDWWVKKSYDELSSIEPPAKPHAISAIASTKDWIAGHRLRTLFIDTASREFPDMDVFGHGREKQVEDKWDGLAPYRYSLAIENTSKSDYWTEKIADCFLSWTVPLYFGATNIADYFPEGSYIWLPIDDPDRAIGIIRDTLTHDDWSARIEPLREARRLILEKYSLGAQIKRLVLESEETLRQAPRLSRTVHGRRTGPGGWIRGAGILGNAKAILAKRKARLSSASS
jgi:hypothetical protein